VDGFDFPLEKWWSLICSFALVCWALLEILSEGDDWRDVLDTKVPLSVKQSSNGNSEFSFEWWETKVHSSTFKTRQGVRESSNAHASDNCTDGNNHALFFDTLTSCVKLASHGFGAGATRHEELKKLSLASAQWHRGTLCCSSCSIKQCSHQSKQSDPVDRKLPQIMARAFPLHRVAATCMGKGSGSLIVMGANWLHTMPDAVWELFGFTEQPDCLQMWHLWTSILNVVFPEGCEVRSL